MSASGTRPEKLLELAAVGWQRFESKVIVTLAEPQFAFAAPQGLRSSLWGA